MKRPVIIGFAVAAVAVAACASWKLRIFYLNSETADLSHLSADQHSAALKAIETNRLSRPEPVSVERLKEVAGHPFDLGGPEPVRVFVPAPNLLLLDRNTRSVPSVMLERTSEGWVEVPVYDAIVKLQSQGN